MLRVLFILFLSNAHVMLTSQYYLDFKEIDKSDGLSTDRARTVHQDELGYIWIGTISGLNRFDGYQFKTYFNDPGDSTSISSNEIVDIEDAGGNNLWISTSLGLDLYIRDKDHFIRFLPEAGNEKSLSHVRVRTVFKDSENNTWVGTREGLNKIQRKQNGQYEFIRYYPERKNLSNTKEWSITAIEEDEQNNLWIGTYGGGLNKFNKKTGAFVNYRPIPEEKPSDVPKNIINFIEKKDNNLWVGIMYQGLYKFNLDSKKFSRFGKDLFFDINQKEEKLFYSIETDKLGNLWLGTSKTFFIINPVTGNIMESGDNIESLTLKENVYIIYRDNNNNMWVCPGDKGIELYDFTKSKFRKWKQELNSGKKYRDYINFICNHNNDKIWIGTYGDGLLEANIDGTIINRYLASDNPQDIPGNVVFEIIKDKAGFLWISTDNGLCKFDPDLGKVVNRFYTSSLQEQGTRIATGNIHLDNKGFIWSIPHDFKPFKIDVTSDMIIQDRIFDTIRDTKITYIYQDSENTYWIGSRNGVYSYHPENFQLKNFSVEQLNPNSLCNNEIKHIIEDSRGNLWFGTRDGISVYDKDENRFTNYVAFEGFIIGSVNQIVEDKWNNIWTRTSEGLFRYSPSTDRFILFGEDDGISRMSYNIFKAGEEHLFLSGEGAFYRFYPDSVDFSSTDNQVQFTGYNIAGKKFSFYQESKYLKNRDDKLTLTLNYQQKLLDIKFSTFDYTHANKINYAYRINGKGFDTTWNILENHNEISLLNLKPGDYVLDVKASNSFNVWNKKHASLKIVVLPPWWRTRAAYLFYYLLTIILLYLYRRYTLKREKLKREHAVDKIKYEKAREIDQLKINFFMNVSHEFRAPLTLITGPLKSLLAKENNNDKRYLLKLIERNAKRLLTLVSQVLDLRKFDVGKLKPRVSNLNLNSFLQQVMVSYYSYAMEAGIKLKSTIELDEDMNYFDPDKLEKIINNLLTNALKYTSKGEFINVNFTSYTASPDQQARIPANYITIIKGDLPEPARLLEFRIEDNGIGIEEDNIMEIFERFSDVNKLADLNIDHVGLGLELTRELVKVLHGSMFIRSKAKEGTSFIIHLPIDKGAFRDEEIISSDYSTPNQSEEIHFDSGELNPNEAEIKEEQFISLNDIDNRSGAFTVLIAEDDPELREFMTKLLNDSRYFVKSAADGKEALDILQDSKIDLIITDIRMPNMNGIELCKTIKNSDNFAHIPVLMLTINKSPESQQSGYVSGADGFLTKPFNPDILLVRVNNLIRNRKIIRTRYNDEKLLISKGKELTDKESVFLKNCMAFVEKNIDNSDFDKAALCKEMGISPAHLYRRIRKLTNQSVNEFIRNIRLNKAAQILQCGKTINISELAYTVGFSDPNYFTRTFKERFGLTPSQYNNKYLSSY